MIRTDGCLVLKRKGRITKELNGNNRRTDVESICVGFTMKEAKRSAEDKSASLIRLAVQGTKGVRLYLVGILRLHNEPVSDPLDVIYSPDAPIILQLIASLSERRFPAIFREQSNLTLETLPKDTARRTSARETLGNHFERHRRST